MTLTLLKTFSMNWNADCASGLLTQCQSYISQLKQMDRSVIFLVLNKAGLKSSALLVQRDSVVAWAYLNNRCCPPIRIGHSLCQFTVLNWTVVHMACHGGWASATGADGDLIAMGLT